MASISGTPEAGPLSPLSPSISRLDELIQVLRRIPKDEKLSQDAFERYSNSLQEVRLILVDSSRKLGRVKDEFRRSEGFEACLNVLESCPLSTRRLEDAQYSRAIFDVLHSVLAVLSEALLDHTGNRDYFANYNGRDCWLALTETMLAICMAPQKSEAILTALRSRIFGLLFAFALLEEGVPATFRHWRADAINAILDGDDPKNLAPATDLTPEEQYSNALQDATSLWIPQGLIVIARIWLACEASEGAASETSWSALSASILSAIYGICSHSDFNAASAHTAGLTNVLLKYVLNSESSVRSDSVYLEKLCSILLRYGLTERSDAIALFRMALKSSSIAKVLLQILQKPQTPAHFVFDLSLHGYASIEFASLKGGFPPTNSSGGYTFAAWFQISTFDAACHTTICGAFDETQTCFFLVYLEKSSRQLVLQTSTTASRPSVRFRSVTFEEGPWYHLAIVHHRPRSDGASRAALFVNGEFREQVRCHYPDSPPSSARGLPSGLKNIQAFFGTPRDLTPRPGSSDLRSSWNMASAYLIADALPDELIFVYQVLGPGYQGNFRDSLGSFQTYAASAQLNIRNEALNPAHEDRSLIARAVKGAAANLVPEQTFLLGLSAQRTISGNSFHDDHELGFNSFPSRTLEQLQKKLRATNVGRVALNQAVPYLLEALTERNGTALMTGGIATITPSNLNEWSWRLGGCVTLAIQLLSAAETDDDIVRNLAIILELIRNDWRNSEAFERENGFAVVAWILRRRLQSRIFNELDSPASNNGADREDEALSAKLLQLILNFVGFNPDRAEDSVINNPLAYRSLLLDTDIWRTADMPTQELYYKQFVIFASASRQQDFNLKRLVRMRAAKKLLDSLKTASIYMDACQCLLDAFRVLLVQTPSTELYRSVALYVTYATSSASRQWKSLSRTRSVDVLKKRQSTLSLRPEKHGTSERDNTSPTFVSQVDLGAMVLQSFADVLLRDDSGVHLKRFAKTVTNKWLLFLLTTEREDVTVAALSILGKLLQTQPTSYLSKFESSSNGFIILRKALRPWSASAKVWKICFALLLGSDVLRSDLDGPFKATSQISLLERQGHLSVSTPAFLPVIMSMLDHGFSQRSSSSAKPPLATSNVNKAHSAPVQGRFDLLEEVTKMLALCDSKVEGLRSAEINGNFVRDCMRSLNATLMSQDEHEMQDEYGRASDLVAQDEARNPHEALDSLLSNMQRPTNTQNENYHPNPREYAKRRLSSFVLVQPDGSDVTEAVSEQPRPRASSKASLAILNQSGSAVLEHGPAANVVDILTTMFTEQLISQKEFTGLGLYMKATASPPKRRAILNSYLIARTIGSIEDVFEQKPASFADTRAILNLARFIVQTYEALIEGWFVSGTLTLITFCSRTLWHLEHGILKNDKQVRLCTSALRDIRFVLRKATAFHLYSATFGDTPEHAVARLDRLFGWRVCVAPGNESDEGYCAPIVCCLLAVMMKLNDSEFEQASSLLRKFTQDGPDRLIPTIQTANFDLSRLGYELYSVLHEQREDFRSWIEAHRGALDTLVKSTSGAMLEPFIDHEIYNGVQSAQARTARRRQRLGQWHLEEVSMQITWTEFTAAAGHWTDNIFASESRRIVRMRQDQQESFEYIQSQADAIAQRCRWLRTPPRFEKPPEWALDNIEGRDRMRLRLAPTASPVDHAGYEPKRIKAQRKATAQKSAQQLTVDTSYKTSRVTMSPSPLREHDGSLPPRESSSQSAHRSAGGDDFEVVADPAIDDEDEDKNRKVMRSLERGEQVKNVFNVSKIVGLEAYESLLIIGNNSLYLIGGLFQRSDGEVVSVRQAPPDERDKYTQVITGREMDRRSVSAAQADSKVHWLWSDILSVSKRQFLTRPVALEFFFADGRSFLMTALNSQQRNQVHAEVISRITEAKSRLQSDQTDADWRMDLLRDREEPTSRFSQVIAPMISNPVTRRWMRGELSNFHYLMYVNTMAGRTFNDLTQYPIFPWVIADYTSEDLDLSSPYSYRDLTKPMGCQTHERAEFFKERYSSFAEMDDQTPAFHYGTHYSTAMIVTSFLIRLQPFVHSHVLLQGGSFDFADRLFFSVEKAWRSASRENNSDVRELIPEFFYLPDFLKNINGYDFGVREGSGEPVNDVELPPWAKGDPNIFIAKNREALESPFVTQNLHGWIDLIFGFKQRGEGAVEAVNVFHYLSYPGAKDLDQIDDQHERAATIGIIHNFGQTPRQIFHRPHDRREAPSVKTSRIRKSIQSMAMLTAPVLERAQAISELRWSRKLVSTCPRSILVPSTYSMVMDWNFSDHSVRFVSLDTGKCLAIFEQMHQLPLSAAHFSDRRTLVTASEDCSLSVWTVRPASDRVDLRPRGSLFTHETPVNVLASSKAFGTLLSASLDGVVCLWDLNRLESIRQINCPASVECAQISEATGHLLLCCGRDVLIYTLNGQLLVRQSICEESDALTSCSFRSLAAATFSSSEVFYTGHRFGFVNIWELSASSTGEWLLSRINQLRNDRRFPTSPGHRPPWITCVLPHDGKVFVGDRDGRAYEWNVTK